MTKFLAICGCGLTAVNAVERAIGNAAGNPIPDEYRWLWFVVAVGWALITYRVAFGPQANRVRGA